MTIADHPSIVTLPEAKKPYPSILAFLLERFPRVSGETWLKRIEQGKVLNGDGAPINPRTPYTPHRKLYYFREKDQEPIIPFSETILFHNEEILVACKPHFLPVIPGGPYINECLLNRLQKKTGNPDLAPVNRIDRETAGLVLFSVKKENRGIYHDLFRHGVVEKTYHAVCQYPHGQPRSQWLVENRIERGSPWFRMKVADGPGNSRTRITLLEVRGERARFQLTPVTGKKHQLRVHMSGLGFSIINDRYYPDLQPEHADDFNNPLQLVAQTLQFHDPITGRWMEFRSTRNLSW
ncbi:MAG: pseudouridine synthase [Deltaproteobacteria bacterium]|nr:pseudouridine synthase [Deltaproteobacteria bacterium]